MMSSINSCYFMPAGWTSRTDVCFWKVGHQTLKNLRSTVQLLDIFISVILEVKILGCWQRSCRSTAAPKHRPVGLFEGPAVLDLCYFQPICAYLDISVITVCLNSSMPMRCGTRMRKITRWLIPDQTQRYCMLQIILNIFFRLSLASIQQRSSCKLDAHVFSVTTSWSRSEPFFVFVRG